jgi:hypothetical protein
MLVGYAHFSTLTHKKIALASSVAGGRSRYRLSNFTLKLFLLIKTGSLRDSPET